MIHVAVHVDAKIKVLKVDYGLIDAFYLYSDRSLQFSIDDYVNDMHQSSYTDFSQQ